MYILKYCPFLQFNNNDKYFVNFTCVRTFLSLISSFTRDSLGSIHSLMPNIYIIIC